VALACPATSYAQCVPATQYTVTTSFAGMQYVFIQKYFAPPQMCHLTASMNAKGCYPGTMTYRAFVNAFA